MESSLTMQQQSCEWFISSVLFRFQSWYHLLNSRHSFSQSVYFDKLLPLCLVFIVLHNWCNGTLDSTVVFIKYIVNLDSEDSFFKKQHLKFDSIWLKTQFNLILVRFRPYLFRLCVHFHSKIRTFIDPFAIN